MATVIDLSALGPDGFLVLGDGEFDKAGFSVASAGDVDGDGLDDFIIGAPYGDDGGYNSGQAYVVFGRTDGFGTLDLASLAATDGFVIQGGLDGDYAGSSVSSAGDVNGDGFDDLIIGAPLGDGGGYAAGQAYVLLGKADGLGTIGGDGRRVLDLSGLGSADGFAIHGGAFFGAAGFSVSGAGDVNGDGHDDLIVGAHRSDDGQAYVVFGKADGFGPIDVATLAPEDGFIIQGGAGDYAGYSVSGAGDVNGDGFDDLIIGAPLGDGGGTDAGAAYVLFGTDGGFGAIDGTGRSVLDLISLDPAGGFVIQGDASPDNAGISVSAAGDVNGDDIDDLVVGAHRGGGGKVYLLFGKTSGLSSIDLTSLAATDGFVIEGAEVSDNAGFRVADAGDVNADGFDDLLVGVPGGDGSGDHSGEVAVVFGKASGFGTIDLADLDEADGFIVQRSGGEFGTGNSLASAGDVDGDGFGDLVIGLPYGEQSGSTTGEAYLVFGRGALAFDDFAGTTEDQALMGSVFADNGSGADRASRSLALQVVEVNSSAAAVGATIALASGARLRVEADGSYVYDPDDAFDYLAAPGSGAANIPATDSFTYTLANGNTATVTVTITGVDSDDILVGTGGVDVMSGGIGEDRLFGLSGHDQLHGGSAPDRVVGGDGDDLVDGGRGHDSLEGGAGDDILDGSDHGIDRLDGGTGADTMTGGVDNDTYVVDNAGDIVIELRNQGNDRVESTISYDLPANLERLFLMGPHHLVGRGNALDNKLFGNAGKNFLNGGAGDDVIDGSAGSDRLYGSEGHDLLIGGAGNDRFHFNTALGPDNVDLIADYTPDEDTLYLARYAFAGVGPGGTLGAGAFVQGSSAGHANDRIVYDPATGNIFYDGDGSGAASAILFATVSAGTPLSHSDFYVYG